MKTKYLFNLIVCLALFLSVSAVNAVNTTDSTMKSKSTYIINPFSSPDWIAESDLDSTMFGSSVASAGDVNGDGFADVIVGAPYYSNGEDMEGRAYVYHGSASGLKPLPVWTFESNLVECELGWSVASAGDVNGDDYDDVLVASEYCGVLDREGRVYLFLGSASGLSTTYDWMIQGGVSDESLGRSIASAGDVNKDGYDDIIVGAPWASYPDGHEGRAYVFYGSPSGLPATANWIAESNVAWTDFGMSVASAGDINDDGYDEVLVGAPWYSHGENSEGRAFLYYGSPTGLRSAPIHTAESNQEDAYMGYSVASAGDVNGDGIEDIIVGISWYDGGQGNEGRVIVYHGQRDAEYVNFVPIILWKD